MPSVPDPSRRAFLLGATAALAVTPRDPGTPDAARKPDPSLIELSAVEAVARIAGGELSAERYATALLERCRATAALNAFITLEPERVLEAARACDLSRRAGAAAGPLFGLPIPVKDSVNTHDYPTTAGTPALRNFRPREDAPVVAALRSAGALVLGKTNLHELSYGWTSNNLAFGAVRNPYDPVRIPGGSSGGTAAAVAARAAPLGVAEDTEGSIRVPAAMCGLVGFRPTTGRYSTRGCVPISPLFDQVGPHARSVADAALFDAVVAGDPSSLRAASLKGVRIAVVRDYFFTDLAPEVERIAERVLSILRESGVVVVESALPELEHLIDLTTDQVQNHDVRVALAAYLREYGTGLTFDEVIRGASADIQEIFRRYVLPGGKDFVSEEEYQAARDQHLPALRRLYSDFFQRSGVAALIFPATLVAPPAIGDEGPQSVGPRTVSFATAVARNIAPGSTAGLPCLVLPAGLTATGLPIGIELDASSGSDRALLGLGLAIEQVLERLPAPPL